MEALLLLPYTRPMPSSPRRALFVASVFGFASLAGCGGGNGGDERSGGDVGADVGAGPFEDGGLGVDAASPTDGGSKADGTSPGDAAVPGDSGGVPDDVAVPPADAAPSSGCGLPKPATGLQSKTIAAGGVDRHYQIFVPTTYDPKAPTRLVFVFHGLGGDGNQIRSYLSPEAEAAGGALFVYPDGLVLPAYGATAWSDADLVFFDAMLKEISAAYCVDAARVFAAGHSFGGYMTNLVGCQRGDVVRAIAAVSGGLSSKACKGPVAAWIAHGDADKTVPQSEGLAARDHWVAANACASTSKPTSPAPCVAYDGCSAHHPVTWCSFAGGHYPLPTYTRKAIWDFFSGM